MVKVVIIDDHALNRIGLKTILSDDPQLNVVGDYKNFSLVKPLLPTIKPDILIMDINTEEENGLDIVGYSKSLNSSMKIVVMVLNLNERQIVNAIRDDIEGYIHKKAEPKEFLAGLKKVLEGGRYFSSKISTILANHAFGRQKSSTPFLTSKEKEIIRLLMEGYSSKQIAARLDVSPRTIHSHRANILSKFNLNNTTQLVTRIAEQKIVL